MFKVLGIITASAVAFAAGSVVGVRKGLGGDFCEKFTEASKIKVDLGKVYEEMNKEEK